MFSMITSSVTMKSMVTVVSFILMHSICWHLSNVTNETYYGQMGALGCSVNGEVHKLNQNITLQFLLFMQSFGFLIQPFNLTMLNDTNIDSFAHWISFHLSWHCPLSIFHTILSYYLLVNTKRFQMTFSFIFNGCAIPIRF